MYLYLDSFDSFDKPLPQYDDFIDNLKGDQVNNLNLNYERYKNALRLCGGNIGDALKMCKFKTIPKRGREIFNEMKQMWHTLGFRNLEDLLRYYAYHDTVPLLNCIENTQRLHMNLNTDMTNYVTLSSLMFQRACQIACKDTNTRIMVFDGDIRDRMENAKAISEI